MTNKDIIDKWLIKLKFDLVAEYDKQKRRASGKFEEGLKLIGTNTSAEILGYEYSGAMEFGRKPSTTGPPKGQGVLQTAIEQWIKDKGIKASDGISESSLAFLITRKIHREGWKASNQFGATGNLLSNIITEERIQELIDSVFLLNIEQIQSEILNLLKAA
jgi:hypothetical protein